MTQNKIIHIFDDDKFIDIAVDLFESVIPNDSSYFVISDNIDLTLNLVKSSNVHSIFFKTESQIDKIASLINNSDSKTVFIHALNLRKQKLIMKLNRQVTIVWFIWGYDLYLQWLPLKHNIYEKKTALFLNRKNTYLENLKNNILFKTKLYKVFKTSKKTYNSTFAKCVNRIDICVPVIPTEIESVKEINRNIIYAPFTYGSVETLITCNINESVGLGENILVGNSADPANNHIEIFEQLTKLDLGNRKIVVPLSYSGNDEYKKYILKKGEELLGVNFQPLIDYMPIESYNKIIASCNCAIFNNIRQQAVGNIITMGFLGAKLFFNSKGVVYDYYNSLGFHCELVKNLSQSSVNSKLNSKEIIENKKILKQLYGLEIVKDKIKELVKITKRESERK